jgi:hypothetical protein
VGFEARSHSRLNWSQIRFGQFEDFPVTVVLLNPRSSAYKSHPGGLRTEGGNDRNAAERNAKDVGSANAPYMQNSTYGVGRRYITGVSADTTGPKLKETVI